MQVENSLLSVSKCTKIRLAARPAYSWIYCRGEGRKGRGEKKGWKNEGQKREQEMGKKVKVNGVMEYTSSQHASPLRELTCHGII